MYASGKSIAHSYSYINSRGEAEGRYKGQSPSVVARKIFKQIYMDFGKIPSSITFKKNDYTNDHTYKYTGRVTEYKTPIIKHIGNSVIEERYKIQVKRI